MFVHFLKNKCICRYKSLSRRYIKIKEIGKQLYVLSLYFKKALIFFKMCTYISMYLFHILVHIGLREVFTRVKFKLYTKFCSMKEFSAQFKEDVYSLLWFWAKLAPPLHINSFMMRFSPIELAYSDNVLFRLAYGLMDQNPVFLLNGISPMPIWGLPINSFYYEYSYLSIFGKVFV